MAQINVGKNIFEGTSVAVPDMEGNPAQFIGQFNSIPQPKFISGKGQALSDVGDMIQGAAKLAVNVTEAAATDDLQRRIDPIMEQRQKDLEKMRQSLIGGVQGPEMPQAVKDHETTISNIVALKATGAVSDSDYHARILKAQKEVRGMYPPGFRPFIDKTTDQITKLGHANETMAAITADINAITAHQRQEREKLINVGIEASKMSPGFSEKVRGVMEGRYPLSKMYDEASKIIADDYQIQAKIRALNLSSTEAGERKRLATEVATYESQKTATDHFANALEASDAKTPAELSKLMLEQPEWARGVADKWGNIVLPQMENAIRQNLTRERVDPTTGRKYTLATDMGGDTEATVTAAMAFPKAFVQAWKDQQTGVLYSLTNAERAAREAAVYKKIRQPGVEESVRTLQAIQEAVSAQGMPAALTVPIVSDLVQRMLYPLPQGTSPGTQGAVNEYNARATRNAPDPVTGRPPSTKDEIETNRRQSHTNNPQDTKAFLEAPKRFILGHGNSPVEIEAARNHVNRLFGPQNYGLVANMDKTAQLAAWKDLTSNEMMTTIKGLGPTSWGVYREFIVNTATRDLIRPSILELNRLSESAEIPILYDDGKGPNGNGIPSFRTSHNDRLYGFDKINEALIPYLTIMKEEGRDLDGLVGRVFEAMGANERVLKAIKSVMPPEPSPSETAAERTRRQGRRK